MSGRSVMEFYSGLLCSLLASGRQSIMMSRSGSTYGPQHPSLKSGRQCVVMSSSLMLFSAFGFLSAPDILVGYS